MIVRVQSQALDFEESRDMVAAILNEFSTNDQSGMVLDLIDVAASSRAANRLVGVTVLNWPWNDWAEISRKGAQSQSVNVFEGGGVR